MVLEISTKLFVLFNSHKYGLEKIITGVNTDLVKIQKFLLINFSTWQTD